MPFVQRVVEPRNLSRTSLRDELGANRVDDGELEAVANNTLSNALRQLASLVLAATDVFAELTIQLDDVGERSKNLKTRMDAVEAALDRCDPKKVPVPESDICTFAARGLHFQSVHPTDTTLFTPATRPSALRALYDAAGKAPGTPDSNSNRPRKPSLTASDGILLCTPVLGARRRRQAGKIDAEIETRLPAAVEELRRWTSSEALGDITVTPDCISRVHSTFIHQQNISSSNASANASRDDLDNGVVSGDDMPIDHKLPSPEEQLQAVALKFPAVMVAVDITGRRFDRMSRYRRTTTAAGVSTSHTANHAASQSASQTAGQTSSPSTSNEPQAGTVRRRTSRARKPRGKRRNTIAGTDRDEIQQAVNGERSATQKEVETPGTNPPSADLTYCTSPSRNGRSQSGDPFKSSTKRSHFSTLKQWGKSRLKMMNRSNGDVRSSNGKVSEIEDINLYETVTMRRKHRDKEEDLQQNQELVEIQQQQQRKYSSSSDKSSAMAVVKLRDATTQRRNRDEPHSSSGNWSASSESGRASIGSETTTTQPRSTPTISGSSCLAPGSVGSRRRFVDTSASCSEGTLTPDIGSHVDDETSSAYSCDTEGYYTSFHVDSGLKTLREEDSTAPVTPLHCSNALHTTSGESEYELFGRGSTSTTTSSAGTVCTALRASGSDRSLIIGPAVPERKSSLTKLDRSGSSSSNISGNLDRCGTIKRNGVLLKKEPSTPTLVQAKTQGAESPDSGHNTSSSPIESAASPNGCSEFSSELSESSDVEGVDRAERIRVKTAINSSRIPSMCAITPPHSDDEGQHDESDGSSSTKQSDVPKRVVVAPIPGSSKLNLINVDRASGYATVETVEAPKRTSHESVRTTTMAALKKSPLMPLLDKLRGVLPNLKKSPAVVKLNMNAAEDINGGEYVTIADVRNNNEKPQIQASRATSEYVSLDELPRVLSGNTNTNTGIDTPRSSSLERRRTAGQGARVTVDSEGRVVYSSDSLKRHKAHSTFEPGPCVKGHLSNRDSSPISAGGKLIVRPGGSAERVRPVVTPTNTNNQTRNQSGAYVNVQDDVSKPEYPPSSHKTLPGPSQNDVVDSSKIEMKSPSRPSSIPVIQTNTAASNFQRKNPAYWTLQARRTSNDVPVIARPLTPEMKHNKNVGSSHQSPSPSVASGNFFSPIQKMDDSRIDDQLATTMTNSFKISPIDPRNTGSFHSSTPSKTEVENSKSKNSEPILSNSKKSTMTNEELYAVIHKSKKKLNIKTDVDIRSGSPAHSIASSGSSGRSTPQTDGVRSRNSWAVSEKGLISELKNHPPNIAGERQSWACSDRLGPSPKTSRLDFKRLLLEHSSKTAPISRSTKISAVEQLKLDKQNKEKAKAEVRNPINILDLSSSPKSFGNRRLINRANQNVGSPINMGNKDLLQRNPSKMVSPRTAWRFANPRSDVLSSPIQEVCSEEDNTNSTTKDLQKIPLKPVIVKRPMVIKAGPILAYPNLLPIAETEQSPSKQSANPEKSSGVNLKDNIFLKIEENNFMKSELVRNTKILPPLSRSQYVQAQRAQFLAPANTGQVQITAQFKNGHYTGTTATPNIRKPETPKPPSPTLETAL